MQGIPMGLAVFGASWDAEKVFYRAEKPDKLNILVFLTDRTIRFGFNSL